MSADLADLSVVLTCHNSDNSLRLALDSVTASGPLRVILVDDGSSDCVCSSLTFDFPHLTHMKLPHGGQATALNAGVAAVETTFIAFLDDDDLWMPGKAARQLDLIVESGADAVVGGVYNVWETDGEEVQRTYLPAARVLGATTFRVEAIRRVGPFDDRPGLHGIIDWWSRAMAAGIEVLSDPEPALWRRIHGANRGITQGHSSRSDLLHHLRTHIGRRAAP